MSGLLRAQSARKRDALFVVGCGGSLFQNQDLGELRNADTAVLNHAIIMVGTFRPLLWVYSDWTVASLSFMRAAVNHYGINVIRRDVSKIDEWADHPRVDTVAHADMPYSSGSTASIEWALSAAVKLGYVRAYLVAFDQNESHSFRAGRTDYGYQRATIESHAPALAMYSCGERPSGLPIPHVGTISQALAAEARK